MVHLKIAGNHFRPKDIMFKLNRHLEPIIQCRICILQSSGSDRNWVRNLAPAATVPYKDTEESYLRRMQIYRHRGISKKHRSTTEK
jgi:hypothetical protein